MEPIDKAGLLNRVLGSRVAAKGLKSGAGGKRNAGAAEIAATDIRKKIANQLAAIDPEWPDAEQRSLEVHVRAALTEELGAAAASDPAFGSLVADVIEAIRLHPHYEMLAEYLCRQLQQAHNQS